LFFDIWCGLSFRSSGSTEVPEVEAEDRPADPQRGGGGTSHADIAQHEAPFEHTDGRLHATTETLEELKYLGTFSSGVVKPGFMTADVTQTTFFGVIEDFVGALLSLTPKKVTKSRQRWDEIVTHLRDQPPAHAVDFGRKVYCNRLSRQHLAEIKNAREKAALRTPLDRVRQTSVGV
jgi:hypothetical protein